MWLAGGAPAKSSSVEQGLACARVTALSEDAAGAGLFKSDQAPTRRPTRGRTRNFQSGRARTVGRNAARQGYPLSCSRLIKIYRTRRRPACCEPTQYISHGSVRATGLGRFATGARRTDAGALASIVWAAAASSLSSPRSRPRRPPPCACRAPCAHCARHRLRAARRCARRCRQIAVSVPGEPASRGVTSCGS